MMTPQFKIAIRNTVTNDTEDNVLDLYFLDTIQNTTTYDWYSGTVETANMLEDVIAQVNSARPSKIVQHINSWGGDADLGMGIYNFLKDHPAQVETKILNSCASIASVMAMAGGQGSITMPRNGFMVIHKAQGTAQGTADDMRKAADVVDNYTQQICDIYAQNNRKSKTANEIYDLIKDGDYWMTGAQAKEQGFVDDCYNDESVSVSNSIAAARGVYNNIPPHILALQDAGGDSILSMINNAFMDFKKHVSALVAGVKGVRPDAQNGVQNNNQLAAAIEQPLNKFAASLQAEVASKLSGMEQKITNAITGKVTAAIEEKYKATLDTLLQQVTNLQADVTNKMGKPTTGAAAASAAADKPVLTGRLVGGNVSTDSE